MFKHISTGFLVFALGAGTASAALAAGDAAEGQRLAQRWCTSCHAVGAKGPAPDAAPTFASLAANPAKTESYLRGWIQAPHPPMPDFELSRQNAEDLTAYIRSLNPSGGKIVR